MYILGDIGNSETKVFLVNSKNRVIKSINFSSKKINNKILNSKFRLLLRDFKIVKKVLYLTECHKDYQIE